ncbi:hypothetical protein [Nocardia sp. IFM 10818]
MNTKTITVQWSTVEYYRDTIEVPDYLDLTDESAVLEQISWKASHCSEYSGDSELVSVQEVSE